jgi:hypothetical protein
LYELVPGGSISHLSRGEASRLIDGLEARRRGLRHERAKQPRTPKPGSHVTRNQIDFIYYLFGRLGWLHDPGHMANFLRKYFHVSRVEDLPDRKRASGVIEALKAILSRRSRRESPPAARREERSTSP